MFPADSPSVASGPDAANAVERPVEDRSAVGASQPTEGRDIQRELDRLEEMILDSPRVPFGRRTLVDEEQLLDQLDLVRMSLPGAFQEAESVVRQREQILMQAEQQARDMLEAARQQAARAVEEVNIVRQAQAESENIRRQVQVECEAERTAAIAEIEEIQERARRELEDMRRNAIAECEAIQNGADDYADRVLGNIERQLSDMMRVIRNGRQQLTQESDAAHRALNARDY